MTTSGTTIWDLPIDEIIDEAIERIGGEPTLGADTSSAIRSLNHILTDLTNRGINLWSLQKDSITLTAGTNSYVLDQDTVDIYKAVLRRNNIDTSLERLSYSEWLTRPIKTQEGRPSQYFVERAKDTTTLYLWATPENSTDEIHFWKIRRLQDAGKMTNTLDIVYRFIPVITAGLAWHLSMKRSAVPFERVAYLKSIYEEEYRKARSEDRERASFMIVIGKR